MISNRQCLRWYLFSFCSYSIFSFMCRCVDHCSSFCCLTYRYCVVCPSFTLRILITPFGIIKLFLEWNILFADLVRHHILILARAVSIWLTNCCLRAGDHYVSYIEVKRPTIYILDKINVVMSKRKAIQLTREKEPHNGYRPPHECDRAWVRALVGSSHRFIQLIFAAFRTDH